MEIRMSSNDPEVTKFKEERLEERKKNKANIEKHLKTYYSGAALRGLMEDLYPNSQAKNSMIPAKKYLSDLGKSDSLDHQKKALDTELSKKGPLWSEVNRLYAEGRNLDKCEKAIDEIKKIIPKGDNSLEKGMDKLEQQGASPKIVDYFEDLLKKLKSEKKTGTSGNKPSNYVSALKNTLIRQVSSLKPKADEIVEYISKNESEFKKKFKNSLAFNDEIEKNLADLKKCKDIKDIEKIFGI